MSAPLGGLGAGLPLKRWDSADDVDHEREEVKDCCTGFVDFIQKVIDCVVKFFRWLFCGEPIEEAKNDFTRRSFTVYREGVVVGPYKGGEVDLHIHPHIAAAELPAFHERVTFAREAFDQKLATTAALFSGDAVAHAQAHVRDLRSEQEVVRGTPAFYDPSPAFPTAPTCFHIGRYGAGYRMTHPIAQIRLPASQLRAMPEAIQRHFAGYEEDQLVLSIAIHVDPSHIIGNGGVNLVSHFLAYPHLPDGAANRDYVPMGIFEASDGVAPARGGAVHFEEFATVEVHPHPTIAGGMAVSPNNGRLQIATAEDHVSFIAAAHLPSSATSAGAPQAVRGAATLMIIIRDWESPLGQAILTGGAAGHSMAQFRDAVAPLLPRLGLLLQFQEPQPVVEILDR